MTITAAPTPRAVNAGSGGQADDRAPLDGLVVLLVLLAAGLLAAVIPSLRRRPRRR